MEVTGFCRARADALVGASFGDEFDHFPLARCEQVERVVRAAPLCEQLRHDLRVERRAAFSNSPKCCREVLQVGHTVFQQIANPGSGLGEQARRDPNLDVL